MIIASNEVEQHVLDRLATDRLDRRNPLSIVCAATGIFVLAAIAFLTSSVRAQIREPSDDLFWSRRGSALGRPFETRKRS